MALALDVTISVIIRDEGEDAPAKRVKDPVLYSPMPVTWNHNPP